MAAVMLIQDAPGAPDNVAMLSRRITIQKKRRGRPRADYKCAISGLMCPFDDNFWESYDADAIAHDDCPFGKYENNNHRKPDGVLVIDDWCKHAILREKRK